MMASPAVVTDGLKKMSLEQKTADHPASQHFITHRIKIFDEYKARYEQWVTQQPRNPISIKLSDGRPVDGIAWVTTPMDIARSLSSSLADRLVIARLNGTELWDTMRPFEGNVEKLELLDFEHDSDAKQVFWHSSAHVLGEACERGLACHLCLGPPLEEGGFYYEMRIPQEHEQAENITKMNVFSSGTPGRTIIPAQDWPLIDSFCKSITKERQPFERLELPKEVLLDMFRDNPFKQHLIKDKIADGESSTVYRCGPLIDLCRGPHVPHTGRIKAMQVTKSSSSYFLGNQEHASLQRIYGISFPDQAQLKVWLKEQEEADRRDHRKIGRDQQLFFFHELSPGSAFFLPHGTRIYNKLIEFMRQEYWARGYTEVGTPNLFSVDLWKQSGHWDNYRENMFAFHADKHGDHNVDDLLKAQDHRSSEPGMLFALKPMNCPGHCLVYGHRERSYRELPLRLAEFGVLHRNELSGALNGLTRVRRFQQDDAHIFCRPDQIGQEIKGTLDFMRSVYGVFGYNFQLVLSTRPEKYLGALADWDKAEQQLKDAMDESALPWTLNLGDGAFYGPKIDIYLVDAHKRKHQCATIQLDFQLPIRFNLTYRGPGVEEEDNKFVGSTSTSPSVINRPVMIHRAILGSLERQFAVLCEHFAGNWPFWLSPRQIAVIPISPAFNSYAQEVADRLVKEGFYADADLSASTLPKKVRTAELAPYKFIVVLGERERSQGFVNVRQAVASSNLEAKATDLSVSLDQLVGLLQEISDSRSRSDYLKH